MPSSTICCALYELSGGLPDSAREKFARLFVNAPAELLARCRCRTSTEFLTQSEASHAYREVSEHFSRNADAEAALKMLQLLPNSDFQGVRRNAFMHGRSVRSAGSPQWLPTDSANATTS